eukprot:4873534-Prymnesium_polylepis.1
MPPTQTAHTHLGHGLTGRMQREQAWFGKNAFAESEPPWRDEANGVMVSYSGHVPRARECFGMAAKGGVPPYAAPGQALGQTTGVQTVAAAPGSVQQQREAAGTRKDVSRNAVLTNQRKAASWIAKFDPYVTTAQAAQSWADAGATKPMSPETGRGFKVGYRGHVPSVRDQVGSSYWSEG